MIDVISAVRHEVDAATRTITFVSTAAQLRREAEHMRACAVSDPAGWGWLP